MQRAFMLSVSALVMTFAANASADSPPLKGAYGFTGSDACLVAPALGFNAVFVATGTAWSHSESIEGILTFNGDGTGTFKNTNVTIFVPPTPGFLPNADSRNGGASFTYTVNADGSFTVENVPGTNKGAIVTGARAGQTFTLENVPTVTGLISENGKTLTSAGLTPGVEIITYSNGDVAHRICHRSRVYIKLDDN